MSLYEVENAFPCESALTFQIDDFLRRQKSALNRDSEAFGSHYYLSGIDSLSNQLREGEL